ncbi:hypothetical protein DL93DRAFT_2031526, partial [Clavulina sp. PMI_390]
LPAALKHLLTQRGPNSLASPGLKSLAPVLKSTLGEAKARRAERGWLCVATATFLTRNSPDAVGELYTFASRTSSSDPEADLHSQSLLNTEERIANAATMREAALKCAVFVGVPKVINSLAGLTAALDDDVKEGLRKIPSRTEENTKAGIEGVTSRGQKLFASVYDPHTEKLLKKLGSYHPDFPDFIIQQEYGALLSDPPHASWPRVGRVGRALTSATGVACLRASGGVGPQLISHVYGLLKAHGYEGKEMDAAGVGEGEEWLSSVDGAMWVVGVVDRLVDVLDA